MTYIDKPVNQRSSSLEELFESLGWYLLAESSSVWLECVLWEHEVVGSNPVFPMPNGSYIFAYKLPLGSTV